MPATDAVQLVHAAIEKNRGIPAVLDAYGEFIDSPLGPLELQNLGDVFARILDNLSQRFPDSASKRAAAAVHNDVTAFLAAANNNLERLKEIMKAELTTVQSVMMSSIAERFRRMNIEERKAVDATLRIVRRSQVELLFKLNAGKQLASGDKEFQRYFALIKSQAPGLRELRYENLIVEKAIFNKLILKSKVQDYFIWVPSFYAKENVDELIERNGVASEHLMLSRLKELDGQGKLEPLKPFLEELDENQGVLSKAKEVPSEISDFLQHVGEYQVLPPIDLDDVSLYFSEEKAAQEKSLREEEEKKRLEAEALREEQDSKSQQLRQKMRPTTIQVAVAESQTRNRSENSIYLGKQLDFEQFVGAINRRVPENDLATQVRQLGDYYIELEGLRDIAIVGSSGSGKSVTLKRLLDGIATRQDAPRLLVIDQKGEHRGIAWKYKWKVSAFAKDSQASELRVSIFSGSEQDSDFAADLIQEWFNQSGLGCSDQQKERIASIIRTQTDKKPSLAAISDLLANEPELSQLSQKLKKSLVLKSSFSRIFSEAGTASISLDGESMIFDISGRGLKDPTTKEERQMLSVLLLRDLAASGIKNSMIVIEDVLDRFKVESLKSRTLQIVQKIRENGNQFVITSRSRCREFLGKDCIELVHRLSGEKAISEEFSEFNSNISTQILVRIIAFLPRGYLITSRIKSESNAGVTEIVKVEQIQFVSTEV
ncbi:MAG: helicase HerA domain-containing protein [Nitrososphaerales archaeon]